MRIRIPLAKQRGRPNCGPACLWMILSYFDDKISLPDLEKEIGYKEGKGTSSIKLAVAAKRRGYEVKLLTTSIEPNKNNLKMDYYKTYMDEDAAGLSKLIEEARKLNIKMIEKSLGLKELCSLITKSSIPIVLLDWNIIRKQSQNGFMGHYVDLIGYDQRFVYVNNAAGRKGMRMQAIRRNIFNKARKATGTDEDIILIIKSALSGVLI